MFNTQVSCRETIKIQLKGLKLKRNDHIDCNKTDIIKA